MSRQVAHLQGFIKSTAEVDNHPLQTRVELILTDFNPNRNKQGVPLSEKQNIMRSALNMPIKIHFDGEDFYGHTGAIPLGPIVNVYEDVDNGVSVIKGEAIIWTEHYKSISDHLKAIFDNGIGTSWEIYYSDSEVDTGGIEWLHDCVFAGTCIVDTPAYGPTRTRILAIAETLHNGEDTMAVEENETVPTATSEEEITPAPDNVETTVETTDDVVTGKDNSAGNNQAQSADEDHEQIYNAQDLLFQLYEGLDILHADLYELERAETANNLADIAQSFADKIANIASRINEMRTAQSELTTEVEQFRQEKAEAENAKAEADLLSTRRVTLSEHGVIFDDARWNERVNVIKAMSEEAFTVYVNDLAAIAKNKSVAEIQIPRVPEPVGSDELPDIKELGRAIRSHLTSRRG